MAAALTGFLAVMITTALPGAPAQAESVRPSSVDAVQAEDPPLTVPPWGYPTGPVSRASVFPCDWLTNVCVKFNKSETQWIAAHTNALQGGGLAGAGAVCSKIPIPWDVAACLVGVGVAGGALADSFDSAAAQGRCVELHLRIGAFPVGAPGGLSQWKTEGC